MSDKNRTKNHESNTKITAQNVEFTRCALYRNDKYVRWEHAMRRTTKKNQKLKKSDRI